MHIKRSSEEKEMLQKCTLHTVKADIFVRLYSCDIVVLHTQKNVCILILQYLHDFKLFATLLQNVIYIYVFLFLHFYVPL